MVRVPLIEIWLVGLASSLVGFVVPIRAGELARSLLLKQRHSLSVAASLPRVAVDRLLPRRMGEGLRLRLLGLLEGLLSGFTSLSRRSGDLTLMLALSLAAAVIDAGVLCFMFA